MSFYAQENRLSCSLPPAQGAGSFQQADQPASGGRGPPGHGRRHPGGGGHCVYLRHQGRRRALRHGRPWLRHPQGVPAAGAMPYCLHYHLLKIQCRRRNAAARLPPSAWCPHSKSSGNTAALNQCKSSRHRLCNMCNCGSIGPAAQRITGSTLELACRAGFLLNACRRPFTCIVAVRAALLPGKRWGN